MSNQWLEAAVRAWKHCKDDLGLSSLPAGQANPHLLTSCLGLTLCYRVLSMCKKWYLRTERGCTAYPSLSFNRDFGHCFVLLPLSLSLSYVLYFFFPLKVIFAITQIFSSIPQTFLILGSPLGIYVYKVISVSTVDFFHVKTLKIKKKLINLKFWTHFRIPEKLQK